MKTNIKKTIELFSHLMFGAFWMLFVVVAIHYLWLILHVAKEDFAFFLSAMIFKVLFIILSVFAPLLLGVSMGLLISKYLYGNDIAKQIIHHGTKAKSIFFLFPTYLISSLVLSTPIEALMGILGVPCGIFISPSVGLVVGDNLTYTGEYLSFPYIISQIVIALLIIVVVSHIVNKRNQ